MVLDIDSRHDGEASLRRLERAHGPLPACPRVNTGGGRQHLIFKYPGVAIGSRSSIYPGIDVRGDDGYIVAPPSRHASGSRYKWSRELHVDGLQPPPLPQWLTVVAINRRYKPFGNQQKSSQATEIIELAGSIELFHTADLEAYGTIIVDEHAETLSVRSHSFKHFLASRYFQQFGVAPSTTALGDALGVIKGRASYGSPEKKVFTRIGECEDAICLDLGDSSWRAVEISPDGWKVVARPRVKFRRTRGMKALPVPTGGGTMDLLRPFLNLATDDDWFLICGWLVQALRPVGPFPVVTLLGEAGSAKSTAARVLREIVDPNTAPLRSTPRDARDLMIASKNSWCVVFDNVSHLSLWLSDALCRLSTGGGLSTRELYTDDQEAIFEASRPVILTGIDGVVTRGDLFDRSIILYLPVIPDIKRRTEIEFWKQFRAEHGRILGALFDSVSCAMRRVATISFERLPRMADFVQWATAAEPALGWESGTFARAYEANRISANTLTLAAC